MVLCSLQCYYELCQRHGRDPLFTIVNIILLWGVRIPASYLLAWLGYGGYAMAGVSLSFVVGLLAMLFYYKSHAWADICARAEAQEAA